MSTELLGHETPVSGGRAAYRYFPFQLSCDPHTYAYGAPLPGLNYLIGTKKYRHGYQGQYAEKDEETGWDNFELRMYDSRIGRWTAPDPAGVHDSPYVGMGNNPVSTVDPDGAVPFGNFFQRALASIGIGSVGSNGYSLALKLSVSISASTGKMLAQAGIGAANAGLRAVAQTPAQAPKYAQLPSWQAFSSNYPINIKTGVEMSSPDVYATIGGPLGDWAEKSPKNFINACAARVSMALIRTGLNIPPKLGTFAGSNGNYYILAENIYKFMAETYGPPTIGRDGDGTFSNGKLMNGKRGIYIMVTDARALNRLHPGSSFFTGHATIKSDSRINGGVGFPTGTYSGAENRLDSYMDVAKYWGFWELK